MKVNEVWSRNVRVPRKTASANLLEKNAADLCEVSGSATSTNILPARHCKRELARLKNIAASGAGTDGR